MVDFIPVDPSEVPASEFGRRGNVSEPILTDFLNSNLVLAKLPDDVVGDNQKSLYSSLASYVRNHRMPVRVISRKEDVFLRRLDLDDEGNPTDWTPPTDDDESENGASETPEESASEYESV